MTSSPLLDHGWGKFWVKGRLAEVRGYLLATQLMAEIGVGDFGVVHRVLTGIDESENLIWIDETMTAACMDGGMEFI